MDEKIYVQKLLEISKNYTVDKIRNINFSDEYHPLKDLRKGIRRMKIS